MIRKIDFVRRVGVAAVRHLNDGPELTRFRNFVLALKVFTIRAKGESLTRTVRSHRFNFYGRVRGHGTRLLALVIEKESEARRDIGFKDGDFNEAVTEVHEEAVVRAAFDLPMVRRLSTKKMKMAAAITANVLNHVVETENHQGPTSDPRQPASNLVAQLDAVPSDQAVSYDEQDKGASQYWPAYFLHLCRAETNIKTPLNRRAVCALLLPWRIHMSSRFASGPCLPVPVLSRSPAVFGERPDDRQ